MIREELEAIEARLNTRCESLINMDLFAKNVDGDMATLIAEVERLTRERDALFIDLKEGTVCDYCIHANSYNDPPCQECSRKNDHWKWRGVREADNAGN